MVNKELKLITKIHNSTKRNYLHRMVNSKIKCMLEAKKYEKNYWDGPRKFGYGGYRYIPGRLMPVAKKLIKKFKLNNKSIILDVGCGKGYLLYEIKRILPEIHICGFDRSRYAIKNAHKEIKKDLFVHLAEKKYPFSKKKFDLALSMGCFHNLEINDLKFTLSEIQRVSKGKSFINLGSYSTQKQFWQLRQWTLLGITLLKENEWKHVMKHTKYTGDYDFVNAKNLNLVSKK